LPRRAFVVVLDACGVGGLPDAAEYGDAGTNTLGHLAREGGGLRLPTLGRLGLGSIVALEGVPLAERPVLHGRLAAIGPGKDSTAGHWADGRLRRRHAAHVPVRIPHRGGRADRFDQRARRDLQPAVQRDRGDRAMRARARL
jgi:hypothetical protein